MENAKISGLENEKSVYWQRVVEEYAASGETLKLFCSTRQIKYATFQYWRNKDKQVNSRTENPRFSEVKIGESHAEGAPIRMRFVNGIEIQFYGGLSVLREILSWDEVSSCSN